MAHGIDANLLRRWVVVSTGHAFRPVGDASSGDESGAETAPSPIVQRQDASPPRAEFVPAKVQPATRSDLHIEIARGEVRVKVIRPIDADHIPYCRQEQINARSGVHTPGATLRPSGGVVDQLLCASRVNVMVQLTSHVLPASGENACSQSGASVWVSVHRNRTRIDCPLNVSSA